MTNRIQNVREYQFTASDELFFDTNIWMLFLGPKGGNEKRIAAYSGAYQRILSANCRIYTDVLVVSEFINTYARIMWGFAKKREGFRGEFKRFRESAEFTPVAKRISASVQEMLKKCRRIDSGFQDLNHIDCLLEQYAQGSADFNDMILLEICKKKGYILVTDDRDFRLDGIQVLTANRTLLGSGRSRLYSR